MEYATKCMICHQYKIQLMLKYAPQKVPKVRKALLFVHGSLRVTSGKDSDAIFRKSTPKLARMQIFSFVSYSYH